MKKIKVLSLFLASVIALGTFTACSKGNTESEGQQDLTISYDLSQYIDENGFLKDINFESDVTLMDYKSIVIPKEKYTPTEEQINTEISAILADYSETKRFDTERTEGVVKDGDMLNIDYVGKIDGVEFEGGSTEGNGTEVTIGVTQYIDDFLQQLIGKNAGETFDIEVTFPDNYTATDLAGKDAVFTVTINSILGETVKPELTDEFCKENLGYLNCETVEDLNKYVSDYISQNLVSSYMYTQVFGESTVNNIPENVLNFQMDYILANYETAAKSYGLTLEEYLQSQGIESVDAFKQQNEEYVKAMAEELIVLQAVAKKENFTVEQADLEEYFGENLEAVQELYGKPFLTMLVLQEKTFSFLDNDTPREE